MNIKTCVKLEFEELMHQMHIKLSLEKQGLKVVLYVHFELFETQTNQIYPKVDLSNF